MLICDDYIAFRALLSGRPSQLPLDEPLTMTPSTWWRILRPVHAAIRARAGQPSNAPKGAFTSRLEEYEDEDLELIRQPDPKIIQVLDSRRILDSAAAIGVDHRGGLLQLESLGAALLHNADLWFGRHRNVSPTIEEAAKEHILSDAPQ